MLKCVFVRVVKCVCVSPPVPITKPAIIPYFSYILDSEELSCYTVIFYIQWSYHVIQLYSIFSGVIMLYSYILYLVELSCNSCYIYNFLYKVELSCYTVIFEDKSNIRYFKKNKCTFLFIYFTMHVKSVVDTILKTTICLFKILFLKISDDFKQR